MKKTFTFNGPLAAVVLLLPVIFSAVLVISFGGERSFLVLFMIVVNVFLIGGTLLASYYRRLRLGGGEATLIKLRKRWSFRLEEVKHFGIIRYRSFRFIYISRAEEQPFTGDDPLVVSNENTFVIQFRKGPWEWLLACMAEAQPALAPEIDK